MVGVTGVTINYEPTLKATPRIIYLFFYNSAKETETIARKTMPQKPQKSKCFYDIPCL